MMFTWEENTMCKDEYVVYRDDKLFCHLSESDLIVFINIVRAAGHEVMRRV